MVVAILVFILIVPRLVGAGVQNLDDHNARGVSVRFGEVIKVVEVITYSEVHVNSTVPLGFVSSMKKTVSATSYIMDSGSNIGN